MTQGFQDSQKVRKGNIFPSSFWNLSLHLANAWLYLSSCRYLWKLANQLLSKIAQLLVDSKRVYILKTISVLKVYSYSRLEVKIFACFQYFDPFMLLVIFGISGCKISKLKIKIKTYQSFLVFPISLFFWFIDFCCACWILPSSTYSIRRLLV